MRFAKLVVAGIFLAVTLPALAVGSGQGKDDEWSVTMNMKMTKPMAMTMPSMTHKVCTPADAEQGPPPTKNADCKVENVEKSGNKTSFKVTCDMQGTQMTGEGWTERSDDTHYKGEFNVSGTTSGMPMAMNLNYSGVRVGSCTAESSD